MTGNITKAEVTELLAQVKDTLREDLLPLIDRKIEAFRKAIWVRSEWCCNDMRKFALQFWGAAQPRTDEMWGVRYQIRGYAVNYCPFCGAFVGQSNAKD